MTRIAHLSDLHLLEEDYRSRTGLARYRLAFLSTGVPLDAGLRRTRALSALRRAKRLQVDHVLITGDLTEDGTVPQYEALADLLDESGLPPERVTLAPGNHDAYNDPLAWQEALDGPLAAYSETSKAGAVTVVGDAVIKPVSTVMDDQHFTRAAGVVRDSALSDIRRLAADSVTTGRTLIVAQHHAPLGMLNPVWNYFDGTMGVAPMRDLLAEQPLLHVVHGHVHNKTTVSLFGRPHAQVFSVASCRDNDHSLRIYRAEGGELRAEGETSSDVPLQGGRAPLAAAFA
jgi:3',5'-cyclic AMP phosphodiesterase CpdA